MSCACCVEQRLAFALQKVGKGRLTLKKEQLSAIRSAYDQEDAFAWLLTGFGKSSVYPSQASLVPSFCYAHAREGKAGSGK